MCIRDSHSTKATSADSCPQFGRLLPTQIVIPGSPPGLIARGPSPTPAATSCRCRLKRHTDALRPAQGAFPRPGGGCDVSISTALHVMPLHRTTSVSYTHLTLPTSELV